VASEPVPLIRWKNATQGSENNKNDTRRQFSMIHEYPLDGKPPMMTHVFENKEGKRIIAAKAVQKRL
jgi:Ca2+-transporting ATPase